MTERDDVVRELGGIEATLKSMHDTMTGMRDDFKEHRKEVDETFEKHSARIGVLENWKWYVAGIAVATPFIIKYIVPLL